MSDKNKPFADFIDEVFKPMNTLYDQYHEAGIQSGLVTALRLIIDSPDLTQAQKIALVTTLSKEPQLKDKVTSLLESMRKNS